MNAGSVLLVKSGEGVENAAPEGWLLESKPRLSLLHHVTWIQGPRRKRFTASTKTRSNVSGGGRKPWKQKGTGRARQGSTRAPQWRHGGVVFGPHPRVVSTRINRQEGREALADALRARCREGRLGILEEGALKEPRVSAAREVLARTGWQGTVLVVARPQEQAVRRAFRNGAGVRLAPTVDFRADQILKTSAVLLTRGAWTDLGRRLGHAA